MGYTHVTIENGVRLPAYVPRRRVCALSRTWMPAFAGMTEGRHPRSAVPSPVGEPRCTLKQGMRGSCLRGERRWAHTPPRHPHPSLLPSREKGSEPARERRGLSPPPPDHPHPSLLPSRAKGPVLDLCGCKSYDAGACREGRGGPKGRRCDARGERSGR